MKMSLSTKIAVSIVSTLVIVMAAGTYLICQRQANFYTQQMKQEADIFADALGLTLNKIMGDNFNNSRYMQRMTEELSKTIGVDQIEVYDLNGIVIADSDREEIGKLPTGPDSEDVMKVIKTGKPVTGTEIKEGKKVYSKAIPIYREKTGKKEMIGVAEISMSLAEIAELLTVKEQAEVLAIIVGLNLQKAMSDQYANQEYMQLLTENLGKQKGVDQIEIYDTTRKVIGDTDRNELGQIATGEEAKDLIKVIETGETLTGFEEKEDKKVYSKTLPIYTKLGDKKELAGALEISMSVSYIQNLIASNRNKMILLTLLIIMAGSITTILLLRKNVISPILSLAGVAKVIAAGDLSKRAEVKSKDEIGELAASFNHMTDEIQKRNEELQTMNEELRSTNEELATSNEELQTTTEELETSNEELRTTNEEIEKKTKELQETQEKLIEREKLAAIGQLASGVGHELRNPLGVIKNAVYYIKGKLPQDPILQKHIAIMEREIAGSNKIISDLLGFARTRLPAAVPSDINNVIEESLDTVKVSANIGLIKELGVDLPRALADPDQIRQVFINLSLNAIQAMRGGGQLKIATRKKDGFIEIEFTDTGCGIPRENTEKIYDPFFTTKAQGIGLGLAVTQRIIESHKGIIEVTSEVNKGTTFLVKLPVQKEA